MQVARLLRWSAWDPGWRLAGCRDAVSEVVVLGTAPCVVCSSVSGRRWMWLGGLGVWNWELCWA